MNTLIISILTLSAGLFTSTYSIAQSKKEKIATAYQTFSKSSKLTNGLASFTVLDGQTGEIVFSDNGMTGLPTASTLKVITSVTALDILGPNYTYKTQLSYTGSIDSLGVLQGDIIVSGTGDPTLGSDRYPQANGETLLNKWIYTIKNAGIKAIHGRIIGDDLFYNGNDVPGGWSWNDIGNYYGAGISGLNWRENKFGLNFVAGAVGQPAKLRDEIKQGHVTIVNEVTTGTAGSGDNVYAYSSPYSTLIYLRGTYGKDLNKKIEASMPDPALHLASELLQALNDQDILVDSIATTSKRMMNQGERLTSSKTALDTHTSPPLKEIVHWFNQKSINLYGEALLKSFGQLSGNKSDTQQAAKLLAKYWEQKLKISSSELHIEDGSGLSPQNRVTTMAIAKIMHYAKGRPWFNDFRKSLPNINGMTMKSGTIGGVLGYTGYQEAAFTFSLLINNYSGSSAAMRQDMFKLLDNLK
ncbi:D-alanyl-D-alanine carboxypeptidase/D-alanyl-D-alanine-endopeptidase [Sphingobacterium deserti]|uniref:D-alanyl-D-alanine carboxypeptidase/D-alanyl-D-alanine-endopeptidase n=1 Tax=Sphingobacterium deserti TaxID=1229276 RepID=A0A0B8T293_9SPHI|nr:D-alanyl-D-alanine carboxypeptidase/D-alanyl-D-alanine-endopeptidase [Sphingobacterium deserti]KGE15322.1 D-alanyl-D-alanine carboxypeptidase/D-alanyl-D-alanine-endopeptidase [Sphingobacterium deserti]